MKLTIPGNPIAKMRPRFARQGSFVKTYDVQRKEIKRVQNEVLRQIREQMNSPDKSISLKASSIALGSCFSVSMWFHMEIPKSTRKRSVNAKLWHCDKHNHKPDCSNLVKFYEDCLNGILYQDDCQIVELHAIKLFSDNPRTEIEIMPIKTFTYEETNIVLDHFTPKDLDKFYRDLCYLVDALASFDRSEDYSIVLCGLEADQFPQKMLEFSKKYSTIISKISKVNLSKHEENHDRQKREKTCQS